MTACEPTRRCSGPVRAGFGDRMVSLVRKGGLSGPSPGTFEPIPFDIDIENPDYHEHWPDELEMYHNPNALLPIDDDLFPDIVHFRIEDGKAVWRGPAPRVFSSQTTTFDFVGAETRAELKAQASPAEDRLRNPVSR